MMIVPIPLMLALDVRMTLVSIVTVPPIVVVLGHLLPAACGRRSSSWTRPRGE